ncbi:MAG: KAP family NTPase [Rhizobium sp.]|nr:KAP family NTPase [Rhizobium sp.]
MSVQNVRAAIRQFLATDTPQVLCVRGDWGTGKTYIWQKLVKELRGSKETIALGQYAYVSLFGVNSITQLKGSILQNTVQRSQIGDEISEESVRAKFTSAEKGLKAFVMKISNTFGEGMFDNFVSALSSLSSRQIICIDDLERKGKELRAADVLGYISYLREERGCKVVLLLNDQQLDNKEDFEAYLEKVVDINLRFAPTSAEIADIAIPDETEIGKMIREHAAVLGITNIRVIRKIYGLASDLAPLLISYSPRVTVDAVRTLAIFGWSVLQPELAPSVEYLKKANTYAGQKEAMDDDIRWRDLLMSIGFYRATDFDLLLLDSIKQGYFVETEIAKHGRLLNAADAQAVADGKMRQAWQFYHNSFTSTADVALNELFRVYKKLSVHMSLNDAVQLERLFRELDDPRAPKFIDMYVAENAGNPSGFDLNYLAHFGQELTDEVRNKLQAAKARQKVLLTPDELFKSLAKRGYDPNILEAVSLLPAEEYYRALKSHEGQDLSDIVDGLRQYLTLGNPNEQVSAILEKAGAALRLVAAESPINRRRAMRLGIIQWLDARERAAAEPKLGTEIASEGSCQSEEADSITTVPASAPTENPPQPPKKSRARKR